MNSVTAIDPEAVNGLRDLNPDDPAFLRELIDLFVSDVGDRLVELDRAIAAGDTVVLTRSAHTIKGSCSNFGAAALMRVSQAMELQGKAGDLPGAAATLPALKAEFAVVAEALQAFR